MRFVYAFAALTITSAIITCMRISGVVISDDASLISIAIVVAGALAGGD